MDAVTAAQAALAEHDWPLSGAVLVRMGVHTGEPQQHDGTYWGVDVHYAARLCSAANGGQVLLSAATRALVSEADVDDLGELGLSDFTESLLDGEARELFIALAAFADAWSVQEAERVVGDDVDAWEGMVSLLDLSLVRVRGDGRLTMAERVRSHARELLDASERMTQFRRRHAELMAEMMERFDLEMYLDGEAMLANAQGIAEEVESAIAWSREGAPEVNRLMGASALFVNLRRLRPLVADIRRLSDQEACVDVTSGGLFSARASVEYFFGDRSEALDWVARALECHRQTAGRERLLSTMAVFIQELLVAGDGPGAGAAAREALGAAEGSPDRRYVRLFETQLAAAAATEGRYEEAEAMLQVHRDGPGRRDTAATIIVAYLPFCALGARDGPVALDRYTAFLDDRVRADDTVNTMFALCGLASSLVLLGRNAEAARLAGGIRRATRELGWDESYLGSAVITAPLDALPSRMPPERWEEETRAGGQLSLDELVRLARAVTPVKA